MRDTFVTLMDRRGRILWANTDRCMLLELPILEYVFPEDVSQVEQCLSRCVVHGEVVTFTARWSDDGGVNWLMSKATFFPVEKINQQQIVVPVVAIVALWHLVPDNYPSFTEQDRELLTMLASDQSIPQIAEQLGRSPSTIDTRIRSLKERLGQRTLHGLISAAMRARLIDIPATLEGAAHSPS